MENILDPAMPAWLLMLGIIALAWLWEDIALVSSALLAVDGHLSVTLALLAIFIGITSGDMGLYIMGRYGVRWRWLRYRMLRSHKVKRSALAFKKRIWSNIFVVRFVPGLRTVCFTSCGYWGVDMKTFVSAMTVAGIVWIGVIFCLIFYIGSSDLLTDSPWKWALILVALAILMINNLRSSRLRIKFND